jgi:LmbE family N-acetylglucosaminyl deacetylase
MRKTALFFAPHPDDVEFGISFYYMKLLEQNYRVVQVSMTDGAFGTANPEFKGKRLVKIREQELNRANKVFEDAFQKNIEILRLGYTDGYLPLTSSTRNRVIYIIKQYKPDIVFAPDPWYSQDYHPDHINTGRLVTFALKKIAPTLQKPIPLILFYSYKPNHYIVFNGRHLKILYNAFSKHKSQISPFGVKLVTRMILFIVNIRKLLKSRNSVIRYRKQDYNYKNEPIYPLKFEKNSTSERIKYHLYRFPFVKGYEKLHNMTPEEVGMEIKQ